MTKEDADKLEIRDGVCFQNGNTLITSNGGEVVFHYSDNNTGTAQRTAIGQTADGTVIFVVTDGRSASSLGATRNDVIDIMVKYGAVVAGMLDGGSSSMLYYEDYFTKYNLDTENFDKYQKEGLVNSYKAFTPPRRLPTFFCVAKEGA
jgi:exopolysaccharide biosynthesis protein